MPKFLSRLLIHFDSQGCPVVLEKCYDVPEVRKDGVTVVERTIFTQKRMGNPPLKRVVNATNCIAGDRKFSHLLV